jgi:glycosyltransferase involved in cell wall biosynthesis
LDKKKRILYIVAGETGFINMDEKILSSFADVRKTIIATIWDCLKLDLLLNYWFADTILIWFASMHTIPAVLLNYLFNKPLCIIAGGWDVANVPEIKYGGMQGGSRTAIGRWLLSRASKVIAVSKSNRQEIINNGKVHHSKVKLIYNAVSLTNQRDLIERKDQVLTVGEINEDTYLRKGLDSFIDVAHRLPKTSFIHVGKWTDKNGKPCTNMINYVKKISPPNIQYIGFVNRKGLEQYYNESKVYLQLSRHEAFGISVVEALKGGCLPIVSNCYALPEIIGDSGYVVKEQVVDEAVEIIKTVLSSDYNIIKPVAHLDFSIEERKKSFMKIL